MESKFVIRRQDRADNFEEWSDETLDWGPEHSFPFFHRSEAERALLHVPKRFKPIIVELEDDGPGGQDDHAITDNGYPGDL